MKGLVYNGPRDVSVKDVPDATIERPTDVLVKSTTTNICPKDANAATEPAKKGEIGFDFGMLWFKGQSVGTGQTPVKRYNRQLRELIHAGRAQPSFIVSHELPLTEAPNAYQHFDARDQGWTEVVLKPAA